LHPTYARTAPNTLPQYDGSIESAKMHAKRAPTADKTANTPKHDGTSNQAQQQQKIRAAQIIA